MTKPFLHRKVQNTKRFKKIKKNQELPPLGKFVTEVLIFRSSSSQMFFKIGALKTFPILEPLFHKVPGLLLKNTYSGCFWIFATANTFLQLNLVFTAESRTVVCSRLLGKQSYTLPAATGAVL